VRQELGDRYVNSLFELYDERVPAFADLCCYWFEKGSRQIKNNHCKRAGLLATQGIRGGANRQVLEGIKKHGDIFFAESDRNWILDGASVHVSMVGFDKGSETERLLNGQRMQTINAALASSADVTSAAELRANRAVCFMGPSPKAPFDINESVALPMLGDSVNPHGVPNSDVVRPVASAIDLTKHSRNVWTIDFAKMPYEEAVKYEAPFEYCKRTVYPLRADNPRQNNQCWWQYERPRIELRTALAGLPRFVATPGVAKHRVFVWRTPEILCNQGTLVFAREDDISFGVLHSRLHEVWARAPGMGTQVRERESGFRYTPTSCFETFPFPDPTDEQRDAIAAAARELDSLRNAKLSPPAAERVAVN